MGRKPGSIPVQYTQDTRDRNRTLCKRLFGLMKKGYEFSEMCGVSLVMIFQDENQNQYFYHSQRSNARTQLDLDSPPHDELDLLKANPLHKFLNLDYLSRADPYFYRSNKLPDKVVFDLKKHKKLSGLSNSEHSSFVSSPAPEEVKNEGCKYLAKRSRNTDY